jgi:TM2 domain-containing membrane protein YozV
LVFCQECGKENPDSYKYCAECGAMLIQAKTLTQESKIMRKGEVKEKSKRKDPWVAALLNFIIAGLGMAYVGQYAKAVLSFIIVWICGFISVLAFNNVFILAVVGNIFVIAWSYDEAKKYNEKIEYN